VILAGGINMDPEKITVVRGLPISQIKKTFKKLFRVFFYLLLGVQLSFRRFPIDGFSGKWWSK